MSDENRQTRPTEMHEACRHPVRPSRRGLIAAGAALGVAGELLAGQAVAAGATATLDRLKRAERDPTHRILLKGGIVLSLDPKLGDFDNGDVLIEGKKILAVGRSLDAPAALVIDARGRVLSTPIITNTKPFCAASSPTGYSARPMTARRPIRGSSKASSRRSTSWKTPISRSSWPR